MADRGGPMTHPPSSFLRAPLAQRLPRKASQPDQLFSISNLVKRFEDLEVLRINQLAVQYGEILAIVGPSGCGKTTLLNCLAGLEPINQGRVSFRGEDVTGPLQAAGMVFQRSSVFPWFTVRQNLVLPGTPLAQLSVEAVDATLQRFSLEQFGGSWPRQLSGGMLRRLELARAMLRNPAALLLDEPFSALDPVTKAEMHTLVRNIRREHGVSVILVTHDVDEAVALADRVVVLSSRPGTVSAEIPIKIHEKHRTIHSTARDFVSAKENVLTKLGWAAR